MSGGGQQPVTQQTTQTRDPWSQAQPNLIAGLGSASASYFGDVGYQPWTGGAVAPINPNMAGAMGLERAYANPDAASGGTAGVNAGRQLGLNMIQNQGLSPELRSLYEQAQGDQNPYLQSIIDTSNRRINDKIGSSMSGAGRYGSGQHTDIAARAMAEAADPLLAQDFARRQEQMQSIAEGGLQRAGTWSTVMPALDEARYAPIDRLKTLGQYEQERSQQQLEDQIKVWNAQQARPWEQLARFNAISTGAGGLGGTQFGASTTPINTPSTLQKMLGGGLAGAGMGSMFGAPGAAIGGLGGSLLGLL